MTGGGGGGGLIHIQHLAGGLDPWHFLFDPAAAVCLLPSLPHAVPYRHEEAAGGGRALQSPHMTRGGGCRLMLNNSTMVKFLTQAAQSTLSLIPPESRRYSTTTIHHHRVTPSSLRGCSPTDTIVSLCVGGRRSAMQHAP